MNSMTSENLGRYIINPPLLVIYSKHKLVHQFRTRSASRNPETQLCERCRCPCRPLTSQVFGSPPGGRLSGAVGPRRVAAKFLTRVFVCPGEGLPGPSTATLSLAQAPATKAEAEQLALVLETACRLTALAAPPLARSRERRPGPPTAHS